MEDPRNIPGEGEIPIAVSSAKTQLRWNSEEFFKTYNSATLRRGYKVYMNTSLGRPFLPSILLNKVLTKEEYFGKKQELKDDESEYIAKWKERQKSISPNRHTVEKEDLLEAEETGGLGPIRGPGSINTRGRLNYIYNMLTSYDSHPVLPQLEKQIPPGYYFNPYSYNMITRLPPQLYDGMIEYDDGTPASLPQMAHDLAEFIAFLERPFLPDLKVKFFMFGVVLLTTLVPLTLFYHQRQAINHLSYRVEMYSIKNGGAYSRFKERFLNINFGS